jgi:anti-anti-sigma factor
MKILKEKINDVMVMRLVGRLDSNTSPEFEKEVFKEIEKGPIYVVLDFERLEYLSSAGLRSTFKITKHLNSIAGKLIICSIPAFMREIFEISGFDTIIKIVPTLEKALRTSVIPATPQC